jgi:uncharacterized protein YjbI with pentapeptide repeats
MPRKKPNQPKDKKPHLNLLKRSVEEWNAFRNANPEVKPNLTGADLSDANLTGAYLAGAYLAGANLTRADLNGANLTDARLIATVLNRADLSGTNLSGASFNHTILADMDLRQTKGLDSVEHAAPSTIGIDTIYRSGGQIPEVFLRGCGVPENFITFARSLTQEAFDFYSCFISYSHADKAFARRLHDALQGRGIRCWLDEHQVLPGQDIYEEVERGIRLWDKVLLCASKDSLTSWWVDSEIGRAFDKEQQIMKTRGEKVLALIPLNLDGYLLTDWKSGLCTEVKRRLAADFTGWDTDNAKFEAQFERLVRALKTDGGRELPPDPKL